MSGEQGDYGDPQTPRDVMDRFWEMVNEGRLRDADVFMFNYRRQVARAMGELAAQGDAVELRRVVEANLGILVSRKMLIEECTKGLRKLVAKAYSMENNEELLHNARRIAGELELPMRKIMDDVRGIKDTIDEALSWDVVMKQALERYHAGTSSDPDYMRKAKGNLEYGLERLEAGIDALHEGVMTAHRGDGMIERGYPVNGARMLYNGYSQIARGRAELEEGVRYLEKASRILEGATEPSEHQIGRSIRRMLDSTEKTTTMAVRIKDVLMEVRRHRQAGRIRH